MAPFQLKPFIYDVCFFSLKNLGLSVIHAPRRNVIILCAQPEIVKVAPLSKSNQINHRQKPVNPSDKTAANRNAME